MALDCLVVDRIHDENRAACVCQGIPDLRSETLVLDAIGGLLQLPVKATCNSMGHYLVYVAIIKLSLCILCLVAAVLNLCEVSWGARG